MKVKTRKSSQRASVNNHASGILRKKGRKDRNTVDQWETAANLLITSSPKSGRMFSMVLFLFIGWQFKRHICLCFRSMGRISACVKHLHLS